MKKGINSSCYKKRVHRNELELKSVTEQAENLRKNLKGISDEDRITIANHETFSVAEQLVEGWVSELSSASDSVGTLLTEFEALPTPIPQGLILPSGSEDTIKKIGASISQVI